MEDDRVWSMKFPIHGRGMIIPGALNYNLAVTSDVGSIGARIV